MAKLSDIEGIGPIHMARLKKAKVVSVRSLLKQAATPKARKELSNTSGIDPKTILDWVKRADLLRIKGIGSGYTALLVRAGIRSVKILAGFEPEELYQALAQKNSALGNRVARLPGPDTVRAWVQQAGMLAAAEPTDSGGGRPK